MGENTSTVSGKATYDKYRIEADDEGNTMALDDE